MFSYTFRGVLICPIFLISGPLFSTTFRGTPKFLWGRGAEKRAEKHGAHGHCLSKLHIHLYVSGLPLARGCVLSASLANLSMTCFPRWIVPRRRTPALQSASSDTRPASAAGYPKVPRRRRPSAQVGSRTHTPAPLSGCYPLNLERHLPPRLRTSPVLGRMSLYRDTSSTRGSIQVIAYLSKTCNLTGSLASCMALKAMFRSQITTGYSHRDGPHDPPSVLKFVDFI